jgi:hypothetical protein
MSMPIEISSAENKALLGIAVLMRRNFGDGCRAQGVMSSPIKLNWITVASQMGLRMLEIHSSGLRIYILEGPFSFAQQPPSTMRLSMLDASSRNFVLKTWLASILTKRRTKTETGNNDEKHGFSFFV